MAEVLKKQLSSAFKMHGFSLRSETSSYLCQVLSSATVSEREEIIDRLIEALQKLPLSSNLIDRATCEKAIQDCQQQCHNDVDEAFNVIDAFNVPRFTYNRERKKFITSSKGQAPLFSDATKKADLFRERYTILHQRTTRHELFTKPALSTSAQGNNNKFELKPVEYLLGSTSKLGDIIVLGMLTQLKQGKWYVEDTTGAVPLDLSRANFHTGLFTENCFVLAEGTYEDEVFHVNAFGFPPPESSKTSRSYFGNINFFGGPSSTCVKSSTRLRNLETENEDAMLVFLSDVTLDEVKVIDKLRMLFQGYSDMPPVCFVFCGNFTSQPYGPNHLSTLRESLSNLADLLSEHEDMVQKSRFVFVPGPMDPGPGSILPRPALPQCVTREFQRRVPTAVFTTNPCRIQYCAQEIVVFREDLVMKMCRNCVRFPTDGKIPYHFAKTLICQAHLCPLPLHVSPVYWSHDQALGLYPLPDLILCADRYDQFTDTQLDCLVSNPNIANKLHLQSDFLHDGKQATGSFSKNDFAFQVYYPATRQVEDSRIEED